MKLDSRPYSITSIRPVARLAIMGFFAANILTLTACGGDVPKDLSAEPGDQTVTLAWSPVANAVYYTLYYSTVAGTAADGQPIAGINDVTDTQFVHTNLTNGLTYYYVVRSVGEGDVESKPSKEVNATPVKPEPALIMGRYQPMGENGEIIRDVVTGLEWQRCVVGRTWDGATCAGTAGTFSRDQAFELTAPDGFHLPTVEELRTIVYCSNTGNFDSNGDNSNCGTGAVAPTVVREAFPGTPNSRHWTSTTNNSDPARWAMGVEFNSGSVNLGYPVSSGNFVRFVRGPL